MSKKIKGVVFMKKKANKTPKTNLTDKQKKIVLYIGIGVLVLITLVIIFIFSNDKKNITEKERLTNYLQDKAESFYKNDYYPQIAELTEDMATFLANFQDEGISMSINVLIDNIVMTEEEAKENMKNKENGTVCDYNNTKAVIYPQKPYKKDSYKIRIQLDCGLDKNEKDK